MLPNLMVSVGTGRIIYYRNSVLNLLKHMFHYHLKADAVQICGNIRSTLYVLVLNDSRQAGTFSGVIDNIFGQCLSYAPN